MIAGLKSQSEGETQPSESDTDNGGSDAEKTNLVRKRIRGGFKRESVDSHDEDDTDRFAKAAEKYRARGEKKKIKKEND